MAFPGNAQLHIHNIGTESLTFTEKNFQKIGLSLRL